MCPRPKKGWPGSQMAGAAGAGASAVAAAIAATNTTGRKVDPSHPQACPGRRERPLVALALRDGGVSEAMRQGIKRGV